MRRVAVCLSLATVAAVLAGCGGDADTAEGAVAAAPAVSRSSTPSPMPVTSGISTVTRPGPGVKVVTGWGSVTYFGQRRPAASAAPAPEQVGTEWVAIDVQTCVAAGQSGGELWNSAWTVTDAGNGQTGPSSVIYSQFPAPQYPTQGYIEPGSCVRGWIVYPIVTGKKLTGVRYSRDPASAPVGSWRA